MTLIRFGPIIVNFDRVTTVRDLTPSPGDGPKLVRIEFDAGHTVDVVAQAEQVLGWARQQATDLSAQSP